MLLTQIFPVCLRRFGLRGDCSRVAVLGRSLRNGAQFQAVDILCGWGLVAAFMTTICVVYARPLGNPAHRILRNAFGSDTGRHAKIFQFTVLAVLLSSPAFSSWSPLMLLASPHGMIFRIGCQTLFTFGSMTTCPVTDLPISYSFWPGYPYARAFSDLPRLTSCRRFSRRGGSNGELSFDVGIRRDADRDRTSYVSGRRVSLTNVGWLCLALLAVTLFNPSFNTSFAMTNQGDTSTMVATAALGLMFWNLIDAIVQKDRAGKRNFIIQLTSC